MADERTPLPDDIQTILPKDPTMTFDPSKRRTEGAIPAPEDPTEGEASYGPRSTGDVPSPRMEAPQGTPYELRRMIGRGGMGEVWEAVQSPLRRPVAVKVTRMDLLARASQKESQALLEEFEREAATTAALEHPNIVPVYDLARDAKGSPLLAMKLVRGTPWDKALRADIDTLPPADVLARHLPILVAVAQAVAFAHSRGVVHRDLKPAQVMLGEYGEVLLMDWGLAVRPADAQAPGADALGPSAVPVQSASSPAGTPAYMAPEQTQGTAAGIGTWTDVYLLGATLYHILAGEPPHRAETSYLAMMRAASGKLEAPSARAPDRMVPPELEAIAVRAMALRPEDRFPSVRALLDALQDWLTGAGKRRLSESLSREASERLAAGPRGYQELNDVGALVERALAEWPGNPALPVLREDVFARHAEVAMAHGDLVLARVQAERLAPGERRRGLVSEIERRDAHARKVARQRSALLKATAALSLATVLVGSVAFFKAREAQDAEMQKVNAQSNADRAMLAAERARREAKEAELQKVAARAEADRANAAAERSREVADVARRVNDLRREEYRLAEEMDGVLGLVLPRVMRAGRRDAELEADGDEGAMHRDGDAFREDVDAVLARRDVLLKEREALGALVGEGMDPPPVRLVIADAYRALAFAVSRDDFEAVYGMFEALAQEHPESPEVLSAQAVAAARLDQWTTATTAMARAAEATRAAKGEFSTAYTEILAIQAGVLVLAADDRSAAVATFRKAIENNERFVVRQIQTLCNLWLEVGEPKETERFAQFALGFVDRLPDRAIRVGNLHAFMGVALMRQDRYGDALPYLRESLEHDEREFGEVHHRAITALSNLAAAHIEMGDSVEGLRLRETALDRAKRLQPPDPALAARIQATLARQYMERNRIEESRKLLQEALATYESLPEDHTADIIYALQNYSDTYRVEREPAKALPLIERAHALASENYPPGHPVLQGVKGTLSLTLSDLGRHEESLALVRENYETEKRLRPNTLGHFDAANTLAASLSAGGMREEAERVAREAYDGLRSIGLADHMSTGQAAYWVAFLCGGRGDWEEALRYNLDSLRIRRMNEGGESGRNAVFSAYNTAFNYASLDWHEAALPYYRTAAVGFAKNLGPRTAEVAAATSSYVDTLVILGRNREAIEFGTPFVEVSEGWRSRNDRSVLMQALAGAHEKLGNPSEALRFWELAIQASLRNSRPEKALTHWAALRGISGLARLGRAEEAKTLWLEGLRREAELTTGPLRLSLPVLRAGMQVAISSGTPEDALALAALGEQQVRGAADSKVGNEILYLNDHATSAALAMGDKALAAQYLRRAVASLAALDPPSTGTLGMRFGASWPQQHGIGDFREVRAAHQGRERAATNAELLERIRDTEFAPPVPPFDVRGALAKRPRLAEEAARILKLPPAGP